MKKKIILVPSEKMATNKKPGRNENCLVRLSAEARQDLGVGDQIEAYCDVSDKERIMSSTLLATFMAFSSDLKAVRQKGLDTKNVGFVTPDIYKKLTVGGQAPYIWISDTISDTVLGADPEFLLFDGDGYVVSANDIMEKEGPIGSDGAMAEVRPSPATSPEGLVENIRSIFQNKDATAPIEYFTWVPGCYFSDDNRDYPVGGHIHIGNPAKMQALPIEQRSRLFVTLNKILDEMISLPMIKIDGTTKGKARRIGCMMGNYGYFGEWRTCSGRLEFRTLSGMWLMHPVLSNLVIGTTKAVIDEAYRIMEDKDFDMNFALPEKYSMEYDFNGKHDCKQLWTSGFDEWSNIPLAKEFGCSKSSQTMIEYLHYSDENNITVPFLNETYAVFKSMSVYQKYCSYIDGLFDILKTTKTNDFHHGNGSIQKNWLEEKKFFAQ